MYQLLCPSSETCYSFSQPSHENVWTTTSVAVVKAVIFIRDTDCTSAQGDRITVIQEITTANQNVMTDQKVTI